MAREFESMEEIKLAFSGIFDRLAKVEPEERAAVLWALNSDWCMGCGQPYHECEDCADCCCGVALREVTIGQCPKCEMLVWSTLKAPAVTTPETKL